MPIKDSQYGWMLPVACREYGGFCSIHGHTPVQPLTIGSKFTFPNVTKEKFYGKFSTMLWALERQTSQWQFLGWPRRICAQKQCSWRPLEGCCHSFSWGWTQNAKTGGGAELSSMNLFTKKVQKALPDGEASKKSNPKKAVQTGKQIQLGADKKKIQETG